VLVLRQHGAAHRREADFQGPVDTVAERPLGVEVVKDHAAIGVGDLLQPRVVDPDVPRLDPEIVSVLDTRRAHAHDPVVRLFAGGDLVEIIVGQLDLVDDVPARRHVADGSDTVS
jgi:hypothetical protein